MTPPSSGTDKPRDLHSTYQWLQTVSKECGVDPELVQSLIPELLDMTRDVAHGPARPAAPLTAFVVGLAAGSQATSAPLTKEDVQAKLLTVHNLLEEFQRQTAAKEN